MTRTATGRRPLTGKQAEILRLILTGFARDQRFPTIRELTAACGLSGKSVNGMTCHLAALQRKGYVRLHKAATSEARRVQVVGLSDAIRSAVLLHLSTLLTEGPPREA